MTVFYTNIDTLKAKIDELKIMSSINQIYYCLMSPFQNMELSQNM